MVAGTHARVNPPMLSGRPLEADNQIVLGAATLAQLHKRVGDTVVASYGTRQDAPVYIPPTRLLIVGTATLPAVGDPDTLHPSMGTGAVIPAGIEPPAFRKFLHSPYRALNGPTMVFVRQLAACVAWQSTVAAAIGGIPLGIARGRWRWVLFARNIYVVPTAAVPAPLVVCVGLGALALANVVAALPGRYAARTPTALVLRVE
jgi:hypothetical protein